MDIFISEDIELRMLLKSSTTNEITIELEGQLIKTFENYGGNNKLEYNKKRDEPRKQKTNKKVRQIGTEFSEVRKNTKTAATRKIFAHYSVQIKV